MILPFSGPNRPGEWSESLVLGYKQMRKCHFHKKFAVSLCYKAKTSLKKVALALQTGFLAIFDAIRTSVPLLGPKYDEKTWPVSPETLKFLIFGSSSRKRLHLRCKSMK